MRTMKLIFLNDVDGVLNNTELIDKLKRKGKTGNLKDHFDNKSLDLLKELVNVSEAKIVIIQSGEFVSNSPRMKNLKNKLKSKDLEIIGTVEDDGSDLYHRIYNYITFVENNGDPVIDFVILSSDDITNEIREYKDKLVITRSGIENKDGFKYKHFMKAVEILMGESYLYVEGEV